VGQSRIRFREKDHAKITIFDKNLVSEKARKTEFLKILKSHAF